MRRLTSLLAALLLGSAAGVVAAAGTAAAAACPQGQGVTVVVGSSISCDANGGGSAADNFSDAGYTLTRVDRQPGFVCQINGEPASASCVNTPPSNAYWGLFWSDGTSGTWKYASQGAYSLSVPAGGWVGFRFQDSNTRTAPGVTPGGPAPKPTSKPTVKPKAKPTPRSPAKPAAKPSAKPTAKAVTPSAKPTASASVSAPTASASPTPSATTPTPAVTPTESQAGEELVTSPDDTETSDTVSAANESDSSDGSGPLGLVAGVLVVALIGGTGAVLWRRKAAGGSS